MGAPQRTLMSDETSKLIDAEIRALVDGAHDKARKVLTAREDQLHLLAQALLEYETLNGEEITQLLKDGKLDRPPDPVGPAVGRPVRGSAIPKTGKRFSGGPAPQGA
jgi:cell division protease FtsH